LSFLTVTYRALTKGRYSASGFAYLATTVTARRVPLFLDFELAAAVSREIHSLGQSGRCDVLAWVLMPDHLHLLLVLRESTLSELMRALKGQTARVVSAMRGSKGQVWQRGFHDHGLRREEELLDIARYIVANPLRAGLVHHLRDYPFWNAEWV
jgi:REP element-mobilizing transposase RayT